MKKFLCFGVALVIMASLGVTAFAGGISFSDVPESHWAYSAVMDMTGRGMFQGTTTPVNGVGTFSPDTAMSRGAFITVIVRYLYPDEIKPTADGEEWWESPVAVAKAHGLVVDGEFDDMNAPMLRQEMAVVLVRTAEEMGEKPEVLVAIDKIADYDKIESTYQIFVRKCFSMGLICGVDSVGTFNPLGVMNRAQGATVIYRLLDKDTRILVDLSSGFRHDGWKGDDYGSDEEIIGNSTIAGQFEDVKGKDRKFYTAGMTRSEAENAINGYVGNVYGARFFDDGISVNYADNGKFAKIVDNNGKLGVNVFGWRKSYDSDAATNSAINMVMEAFYFFTGDKDVAYALWSVVDYMSINGAAATTVDVVEGFGFKTSNETNTSIDLAMNGKSIHWSWGGGNGNYYIFN